MQIIHSLTAVRISDSFIVDIPTYHLNLPISRNESGNGWKDIAGNTVSPSVYMQEQMSQNGFEEIDLRQNSDYFKLSKHKGAWEISGVQDDQVLFASIIYNEDEILNSDQLEWLQMALSTGLTIENFVLIEIEND